MSEYCLSLKNYFWHSFECLIELNDEIKAKSLLAIVSVLKLRHFILYSLHVFFNIKTWFNTLILISVAWFFKQQFLLPFVPFFMVIIDSFFVAWSCSATAAISFSEFVKPTGWWHFQERHTASLWHQFTVQNSFKTRSWCLRKTFAKTLVSSWSIPKTKSNHQKVYIPMHTTIVLYTIAHFRKRKRTNIKKKKQNLSFKQIAPTKSATMLICIKKNNFLVFKHE